MGAPHTKAARRRISLALRGRKKTRQHKQRISEGIQRYLQARRDAGLPIGATPLPQPVAPEQKDGQS